MSEEMSKFIVIIRPEFMCFCKDACRAASFNHLLFRIAGKCKDQPKEKIQDGKILWYANNEQITEEMSNAWGVCKVRQEINDLVTMGIIGRTKDPNWGVNRTKHFFFGSKQCATFLQFCEEHNICFVHLDLPDEVKHLIYSSNANDKSIKCICGIHHLHPIDLSDANDRSIEAITKIDYKELHKEDNKEEREVATATARSQSSSQNDLSEETEKREAVKPSQKEVTDGNTLEHTSMGGRTLPTNNRRNDVLSPSEASGDTHRIAPPQRKEHTNAITQPPAPRKPPTNPVPRRPKQQGLMDELPSSPASKPVEPHAEMTWGTRKCLQWFDYWRGGTLIAKWKLQQAASFAKGLVEQFDEKTVVEIYGDMAKDPYYIERGGPDIGDVANNIHKYLNKKKPKKEPSNEHKATSFYSADALSERNKWKMETFLAEYEAKAGTTQGVQS